MIKVFLMCLLFFWVFFLVSFTFFYDGLEKTFLSCGAFKPNGRR